MPILCNHCDCVTINGVRCHEIRCPNAGERIVLVDDGTLDTVFKCEDCGEQFRYTFDPQDTETLDMADLYNNFRYEKLRETADEHITVPGRTCHASEAGEGDG